jgi:replicative DNA helicase
MVLAEQGGRVGIIDSESGPFDNLSGRYSAFPSLSSFLKAWSGDAMSIERATINDKTGLRKSISVARPALSMAITTQPGALEALRGNKRLTDLGALQRCLFSWIPDGDPLPSMDCPSVPSELDAQYKKLINELLGLEATTDVDDEGERVPYSLALSSEATNLGRRIETDFISRKRAETGVFREWISKAHGQCYRLAGVLHMARHGARGVEQKISAETLQSAYELIVYFAVHSSETLSMVRDGEGIADARQVLKWVRKNQNRLDELYQIKARDLWRQLRSIATDDDRDRAILSLINLGCVRIVEPEEREGAGRRPGLIFQFHHSLFWSAEV